MLPRSDRDPRSRVHPLHPWLAWASRVGLALVFAIGLLSSASGKLYEAQCDPEIEVGEDGQVVAREGTSPIVRRIACSRRSDWRTRGPARPRAPQRLAPTVAEPSRPRWQRPRRAPPPAEDDLSIG